MQRKEAKKKLLFTLSLLMQIVPGAIFRYLAIRFKFSTVLLVIALNYTEKNTRSISSISLDGQISSGQMLFESR